MKKTSMLIAFLIPIIPHFAQADSQVFPISTEMQIGRIRNLVDKAPKGIYLTVGGERAFRGASMFEGIEHLMIFDISPTIIRFNSINIELLKAKNKEDYKRLRWEANFSEWKKVSISLKEEDFKWWDENVRNVKGYDLPETLNRYGHTTQRYIKLQQKLLGIYPKVSKKFNNREKEFFTFVTWQDIEENQKDTPDPLTKEEFDWFDGKRKLPDPCIKKFIEDPSTVVDWGQVIDYKSGNYLFDDKLYNRLHNLVLEDKITVIEVDMTKQNGIDSVTQVIKKTGSKLAVLDLDNLYRCDYMGEEKFRVTLSQLCPFGDNGSILILMSNYKDYPNAQFSIYVGFTFEHIKSWPEGPFFDVFINCLPSDILPLIDGRLYEGKDELPLNLMRNKI